MYKMHSDTWSTHYVVNVHCTKLTIMYMHKGQITSTLLQQPSLLVKDLAKPYNPVNNVTAEHFISPLFILVELSIINTITKVCLQFLKNMACLLFSMNLTRTVCKESTPLTMVKFHPYNYPYNMIIMIRWGSLRKTSWSIHVQIHRKNRGYQHLSQAQQVSPNTVRLQFLTEAMYMMVRSFSRRLNAHRRLSQQRKGTPTRKSCQADGLTTGIV